MSKRGMVGGFLNCVTKSHPKWILTNIKESVLLPEHKTLNEGTSRGGIVLIFPERFGDLEYFLKEHWSSFFLALWKAKHPSRAAFMSNTAPVTFHSSACVHEKKVKEATCVSNPWMYARSFGNHGNGWIRKWEKACHRNIVGHLVSLLPRVKSSCRCY